MINSLECLEHLPVNSWLLGVFFYNGQSARTPVRNANMDNKFRMYTFSLHWNVGDVVVPFEYNSTEGGIGSSEGAGGRGKREAGQGNKT